MTCNPRQFADSLQELKTHDVLPESIEALDTLFVYVQNLFNHPMETKYYTISAVNIHFQERLGHFSSCDTLLQHIGYQKNSTPISHYVFNAEQFKHDRLAATRHLLEQILGIIDELRKKLQQTFLDSCGPGTSHLPPATTHIPGILAAGAYGDRGRRQTMEDQEILVPEFYPDINLDLKQLYSQVLTKPLAAALQGGAALQQYEHENETNLDSSNPLPATSNTTTEQTEEPDALAATNLVQLDLPSYEDLTFVGLYDGHGGTETSDFVVKALHQSLHIEIKDYIRSTLGLFPPRTGPIGTGTVPEIDPIMTQNNNNNNSTPQHAASSSPSNQQLTAQNSPQYRQYLQLKYITQNILTQLPHFHEIQNVCTEDELQTDFSGIDAYMTFERMQVDYIRNNYAPTFSTSLFKTWLDLQPAEFAASDAYNKKQALLKIQQIVQQSRRGQNLQELDPADVLAANATQLGINALLTKKYAQMLMALSPSYLFSFALTQAHARTDNQLRRCLALHSGCTTVACVIGRYNNQRFVVSSNVGDSRAVLGIQSTTCCRYASEPKQHKPTYRFRRIGNQEVLTPSQLRLLPFENVNQANAVAVTNEAIKGDAWLPQNSRIFSRRLTVDHKPSHVVETQRIQNLGGFITPAGRTMGVLAVSRALGDHNLKTTKYFVSCKPHIDLQLLHDHNDPQSQEPYLLLACDGVWDVMQDHEAIKLTSGLVASYIRSWIDFHKLEIVEETPNNGIQPISIVDCSNPSASPSINPICHTCIANFMAKNVLNQMMEQASKRVVQCALNRESSDNVTVLAIRL